VGADPRDGPGTQSEPDRAPGGSSGITAAALTNNASAQTTGGRAPSDTGDQRRKEAPLAFARIKVGLGRPPAGVDPVDFVLDTFRPEERPLVEQAMDWAVEAVECWLNEGPEVAANRFNGKTPALAQAGSGAQ
jgi:hypothetical protein